MQSEECEFGLYQCVYCSDGFNTLGMFNLDIQLWVCLQHFSLLDSIKAHLSVVHPQNFAFACKRVQNKVFIDIDDSSNCTTKYGSIVDLFDKEDDKTIKVKLWDKEIHELTSVDTFKKPTAVELKIMNAFSLSEIEK